MTNLPATIAALRLEENLAGAHAGHEGEAFAFRLPTGYQWSTLPTVSMTGGFSATTASLSAVNETLTLTPDYDGATTASPGVITLTGAGVNADLGPCGEGTVC